MPSSSSSLSTASSSVSSSSLSSSSTASSISASSVSSSSSGEFGASLYTASTNDYLQIPAYRRRSSRYSIQLNDVAGAAIPIDNTNIVRIKIGKDNSMPHLDLNSTIKTANGSSISNNNPVVMVLDQDDLLFAAGVYELEILVLDDATGRVATHIQKGVFILFETQRGDIAI